MISPGDRRRRQAKRDRDRAAYDDAVALLRAHGASCSNCRNRIKSPVGPACDLDSDYEGYVRVKPDDVCPRWGEKQAAAPLTGPPAGQR